MKKEFTKVELLQGRGCYSKERINELFPDDKVVTIEEILKQNVSITDKIWFVYNSCNLVLDSKKNLSLKLVLAVLPIYEEKYPEDSRVREYLQGVEDFKNGVIDITKLTALKVVTTEAAVAAYKSGTYAASFVADAAICVNSCLTDQAAIYACIAVCIYCRNDASKTLTYSEKLLNILIEFFK